MFEGNQHSNRESIKRQGVILMRFPKAEEKIDVLTELGIKLTEEMKDHIRSLESDVYAMDRYARSLIL